MQDEKLVPLDNLIEYCKGINIHRCSDSIYDEYITVKLLIHGTFISCECFRDFIWIDPGSVCSLGTGLICLG